MTLPKRIPRYLRPLSRSRWSESILCVNVYSTTHESLDATMVRDKGLRAWDTALITNRQGDVTASLGSYGVNQGEFLNHMVSVATNHRELLVVSANATSDWSLLGLWEHLECGAVSLTRPITGDKHASEVCEPRNDGALLVSTNPPNIAKLWLHGCSLPVMWVDIRNYGIGTDTICETEPQRLERLVSAIESILRCNNTLCAGRLKVTSGAQSMHAFKRAYYAGGIFLHNDTVALKAERASYYGGRCEAIRTGTSKEAVHEFDFRSHYCSCYRGGHLPARLSRVRAWDNGGYLLDRDVASRAIATVKIETEEPLFPYRRATMGADTDGTHREILPRSRIDDDRGVIYPIGRFTTTLCGPELVLAHDNGAIVCVHSHCEYEMEKCLTEYADAVYSLRCLAEASRDPIGAAYAKSLAVSIVGKLGQRLMAWDLCPEVGSDMPYGEWYGKAKGQMTGRYRAIAWDVLREEDCGWSPESVPAIAAWITSLGRVSLLHAIKVAGWSEVLYCDTDSVFTTMRGSERLKAVYNQHSNAMGSLCHKGAEASMTIRGVKSYTFGSKTVNGGVPKSWTPVAGGRATGWLPETVSRQIRGGQRPHSTDRMYAISLQPREGVGTHDRLIAVEPIVLMEF